MKDGYVKISRDTPADLLFICFFTYELYSKVVAKSFAVLGIGGGRTARLLLLLLLLACLCSSSSDRWRDSAALYAAVAAVFILSAVWNPGVLSWYADRNWGLAARVFRLDRGICAYLIVRLVKDGEHLRRDLKISAVLWTPYLLYLTAGRILRGYWRLPSNDGVTMQMLAYNMNFGYQCVYAGLIFLLFAGPRFKKAEQAAGILLLLLAVIYGSRGVLILILCYVGLCAFDECRKGFTAHNCIKYTGLTAVLLFAAANYGSILLFLQNLFERAGISSRNLLQIASGSISDTNGRSTIWKIAVRMIRARFPFGYGAYGERPEVGKAYRWGYSHNIVLEMTVAFGIAGVILLLVLLWVSADILLREKDLVLRDVFRLFFCCGMKLMISDSFWYNPHFWAALAVCFIIYKQRGRNGSEIMYQSRRLSENRNGACDAVYGDGGGLL